MVTFGKSKVTQQRNGPPSFVETMLKSAQEKTDVKPQTRQDNVDLEQLEKTMANLKKGVIKR